jgi:hypothetical protein
MSTFFRSNPRLFTNYSFSSTDITWRDISNLRMPLPLINDMSMRVELFSFPNVAARIGLIFPSVVTTPSFNVAGVYDSFLCSSYFATIEVYRSLICREAARTPPLIE